MIPLEQTFQPRSNISVWFVLRLLASEEVFHSHVLGRRRKWHKAFGLRLPLQTLLREDEIRERIYGDNDLELKSRTNSSFLEWLRKQVVKWQRAKMELGRMTCASSLYIRPSVLLIIVCRLSHYTPGIENARTTKSPSLSLCNRSGPVVASLQIGLQSSSWPPSIHTLHQPRPTVN